MDKGPESNDNPSQQVPKQGPAASQHVMELAVSADKETTGGNGDSGPSSTMNKENAPTADSSVAATMATKREANGTAAEETVGHHDMVVSPSGDLSVDRTSMTAPSPKKRKDKSRKAKRKSKSEGQEPIPSLRRRSNKLTGAKHLEEVLLAAFQPLDTEGTGSVSQELFWEVQGITFAHVCNTSDVLVRACNY